MTEETKHTPGPWWVQDDPYIHVRSAGGCVLASDYTTEANARLIAAAPELLEALERLCREADALDRIGMPEAFEQADAAIAKAKGKP